jgi:hypothetical protein
MYDSLGLTMLIRGIFFIDGVMGNNLGGSSITVITVPIQRVNYGYLPLMIL